MPNPAMHPDDKAALDATQQQLGAVNEMRATMLKLIDELRAKVEQHCDHTAKLIGVAHNYRSYVQRHGIGPEDDPAA